jgi:hypothetical protein
MAMIPRRHWFLAMIIAAGLCLSAMVVLPPLLHARFIARVNSIRIGDTREDVERVLGAPTERFAKGKQLVDAIAKATLLFWLLMPESPETWAYGSSYFTIRILGPRTDDVVIEFDDQGHVSRVVIPEDSGDPGQ